MKRISLLVTGYISAYLTITLLSSFTGSTVGEIISRLLIRPDVYIIGIICFGISFILIGNNIKRSIEDVYSAVKQKTINEGLLAIICTGVTSILFFVLYLKNIWITTALLLFSLFYGIISVEFEKDKEKIPMRSRGDS